MKLKSLVFLMICTIFFFEKRIFKITHLNAGLLNKSLGVYFLVTSNVPSIIQARRLIVPVINTGTFDTAKYVYA